MSDSVIITPEPLSRRELVIKYGRWVAAGFGLLLFFTFWKLPDAKIKQLVISEISRAALEGAGMDLQARSSSISWIFGPSLRMEQLTARMVSSGKSFQLDGLKASPRLLPFLWGTTSASVSLWRGKSEIDLSISTSSSSFQVSGDADLPAIESLGVLEAMTGLRAKGRLLLDFDLGGKPNKGQTFAGNLVLRLEKIELPEQEIQFLKLPSIKIADGVLRLRAEQGVAKVSELRIGKDGDDIQLKGEGEITLANFIEQSNLNIKGQIRLSPRLTTAMPLIDALLTSGKQADGSYGFRLSGSLASPFFAPGS